jgi:hypothetical protein
MQRHATVATTAVLAAPASPDAQLVEEPAALLRRAEAWGHLPAEGWGRIPVAPLTEEYEDLDLAGAYVRARRFGRPSPRWRRSWRSSTAASPTGASPRPTPSPAPPPRRASPSAVPSTPRTTCSRGSGTSVSGCTQTGSASRLAWGPKSSAIRLALWPGRPGRSTRTAALSSELLLHRVCARRRPTDTGLSARRALRHRPPARTDRHRPMNHQQGSGGAAMPPREPERSGSSGVHLNARRTTSPRGRRSARPIRPEEAQR